MSLLFPTYRHYNGEFYRVILRGRQVHGGNIDDLLCASTGQAMIVFQQLQDGPRHQAGTMWVTTTDRFNDKLWCADRMDDKGVRIGQRFTRVEDNDVPQHVLDKIEELDSRWSAYE